MRATMDWCGETLVLLPERAIWWPRLRTVLVADVHLGKDQVFRRQGIGIPAGPTEADLAALDRLIAACDPAALVILGDLVHAPPAPGDAWPDAVAAWRGAHASLEVSLVLGNHDRRLAPWLARWQIAAHRTLQVGPFQLVHEPPDEPPAPTISGHLHPVRKLREGRRGTLRVPVFWFSRTLCVLPAFGGFTGGLVIEPGAHDRFFAVAGDTVIPLQRALAI